ncbi:cupin domain-containing protein [Amycolatopsis tolypomycina]|uniref:cupin domain-containing protein n=1 Tax=Amycolatopsis tolypomycina TaxID=208445 RepID=UPI0033A3048F
MNTTTTITGPQLDLGDVVTGIESWGAQHQRFHRIAEHATPEGDRAPGLSAARLRMAVAAQSRPHHHAEPRAIVVLSGVAAILLTAPGATAWTSVAVTGPGDVVTLPAHWIRQVVNLAPSELAALEFSADAVFNHSVDLNIELTDQELVVRLRQAFTAGRLRPGTHPAATVGRP